MKLDEGFGLDSPNLILSLAMPAPEKARLDSWKEIAEYLNCSEKTARRREVLYGLPVRRVPGGVKSHVFAYRDEVDHWLSSRPPDEHTVPDQLPEVEAVAVLGGSWRRSLWMGATVTLVATFGLLLWWSRGSTPVRLSGNPDRLSQSAAAKLPPLMMDDTRIYFQERDYGSVRFHLMQAALSGGTPSRLEIPLENPDPGVVAPDGSAMLLRSIQGSKDGDEPLYLQPLPSGKPQRLGEIRAYDSAWTPDGRGIMFSRLRSVYEANLAGVVTRKLFDVPGRAYGFRWAPGGKVLRFSVYDSKLASYQIWQTTSLDIPPRRVSFGLDHLLQQCCGAWSRDGAHYFFQASVGGFFQIFTQPEQRRLFGFGEGAAVQLTSGPVNFRSPLPNPEGDRLFLLSQSQKSEVVQYDAGDRRWIPLLEGVPAATAAYSKDGAWLAYTRSPDHTLWRCRVPGCQNPVQLTFAPSRVTMPRWSPNGKEIAFMVRTLGKPYRASVVSADGAHLASLLPGEAAEADPSWSPAGDQIVFGAAPNPDSGAEASLRIVELRTASVRTVRGSDGYHSPRWSPDGRFLAALRSGTLELALYEFSTGRWAVLPGWRAGYPEWSSDGARVYFLAGFERDRPPEMMAADVATRRVHSVASLSQVRRPQYSFGDWVGLGRADTPLALRDLSTEEVLSWRLERR